MVVRRLARAACLGILAAWPLASCAGGDRRERDSLAALSDTVGTTGAHSEAELLQAASAMIEFLRGESGFDSVRLADSVDLYVSPEGGGAHVRLGREQLRHPINWVIRTAERGIAKSIVPPPAEKLTMAVGRHFNCLEYPLSSRFPELARRPHVGVKLEPENADSCLQVWNVTLVFHAEERPPTLTAAVYDQWEW